MKTINSKSVKFLGTAISTIGSVSSKDPTVNLNELAKAILVRINEMVLSKEMSNQGGPSLIGAIENMLGGFLESDTIIMIWNHVTRIFAEYFQFCSVINNEIVGKSEWRKEFESL